MEISFTLIELLVVLAVIAGLVAILLPSLQAAKRRAQIIKCASNLRQVGLAVEYYKEDNDQYFPLREPNPWDFGDQGVYMDILGSNYMKANWGVFRCPLNRNTWDLDRRTNSAGGQNDYQMNSAVWGMQAHGRTLGGDRRISPPNLVVVVYDWPGPNWFGYATSPLSPHPEGDINAYFADGHVGHITMEAADDLIEGRTPFYDWGLEPVPP